MTCQELEARMDELACKYVETHDKELIKEFFQLAHELTKMEKE
jgi:hypothetical protein